MEIVSVSGASQVISAISDLVHANVGGVLVILGFMVGVSLVRGLIASTQNYDDTDGGRYWRSKTSGKRYKL